MKIFLTGEIQVGKSTVIAKALSLLKLTPAGFKTYFGPDRASSDKLLYMSPADKPREYNPENAVARFIGGIPHPLTEKFDTWGTELIRSARAAADVVLLDECGIIESKALIFQQEILDTLDGALPVFGVIKLASRGSWTEKIISHPRVRLFTVTEENRDTLPQVIAGQLSP